MLARFEGALLEKAKWPTDFQLTGWPGQVDGQVRSTTCSILSPVGKEVVLLWINLDSELPPGSQSPVAREKPTIQAY